MKLSREFAQIIVFYFLNSSFSFISMLLVPIFVQHYGYTTQFALKVQTFSFLVVIIYLISFSRFINRSHLTRMFVLIFFGLSCGVLSLITPPPYMFIFVIGIALYLIGKSTLTTLSSYYLEGMSTKASRLSASAYMHMTANAGSACSGVIAYFFFSKYKSILLGLDLVTSILYVSILFYFINQIKFSTKSESQNSDSFLKALKTLDSKMIWLIVSIILYGIPALCNYSMIPVVYVKLGLDATKATSLMGITNTVAVTLGTFLLGRFSIKNKYKLLMVSSLILAIGMMLVPLSTTQTMIIIVTMIWTIAEAVGWPIIIFYIYEIFPDKKIAAQFRNIYLFICMFLAPFLAWSIEDKPLYLFGLVYGGLPILAFFIFKYLSPQLQEMQKTD